jgi:hypothetical protein
MTTSAAEWLAQNSIDCAPLGARISKAQCQANHGHTYVCEDCPHGGVKYVGPAKVAQKTSGRKRPIPTEPTVPDTQINVETTLKYVHRQPQPHRPEHTTLGRPPEKKQRIIAPRPARCVLAPVEPVSVSVPESHAEPVIAKKPRGTKPVIWTFTPQMDAQITKIYRTGTGDNQVNELAKKFGYPRWAVSARARAIGASEIRLKEPNWCDEELQVLKNNAHLTPERIRLALKAAGFNRSITGVLLKRKRLGMLQNLPGQSATSLAKCFGGDAKMITGWIESGWLKAEKRGTNRTEKQGGDMYYILTSDVRDFIIENIGVIDIRKVDKFWLIETLTLKEAA